MPGVAAIASQLESLKLPLREIKKRYTRSEISIMAWRSTEISANMEESMRKQVGTAPTTSDSYDAPVLSDRDLSAFEERLGPLADRLCEIEDENGLDLSKLTGAEAFRFLNAMGVAQGKA